VPECTIYITNLSKLADERSLKELFNFCGHITAIRIRKYVTREKVDICCRFPLIYLFPRGKNNEANEALIEFENPSALDLALQFSNALVKVISNRNRILSIIN
jgi:RNA recognition motif-containing protein